jgi:XTP/dITP diphosphohydrolase
MNKFTELLIASNNPHKTDEIRSILSDSGIKVYTLKEKGIEIDVIEDKDTLEGNALKKAKEISEAVGMPVFSDDTGLFIDALDGKPGVYSARYAGENASYSDNCIKVIEDLKLLGLESSPAQFKTIICLFISEKEHHFFEGVCKGKIILEAKGENGFGYDPIFVPDGFDKTFAELNAEEKNSISHRGRAVMKFRDYIIS